MVVNHRINHNGTSFYGYEPSHQSYCTIDLMVENIEMVIIMTPQYKVTKKPSQTCIWTAFLVNKND